MILPGFKALPIAVWRNQTSKDDILGRFMTGVDEV